MSIYEAAEAAANHATNAEVLAWRAASLAETAGDKIVADAGRRAATAMGAAADLMRELATATALSSQQGKTT